MAIIIMRIFRILPFLIFCTFPLAAESVTYHSVPSLSDIELQISRPMSLIGLLYSADVVFSEQEFCDITDLYIGQEITPLALHTAMVNLFKKNNLLKKELPFPNGELMNLILLKSIL